MPAPGPIVGTFENAEVNPLLALARHVDQAKYVTSLLHDVGARSVIVESRYFDWNFLSEFAAFEAWGTRVQEIGNQCKRVHVFAEPIDNARFHHAVQVGGVDGARSLGAYLGFIVVRPLPWAPIGRTVIAANGARRDADPTRTKRWDAASRDYSCHVAGLDLCVQGIAWQQQDGNVARCATVAVWSALHAAALDETRGMPTTAQITQWANARSSVGGRVFPSAGLTVFQVCDSIAAAGFAPECVQGDLPGAPFVFSAERFGSVCATALRSGFPVIITGKIALRDQTDRHAVCAVSFREAGPVVLADTEPRVVDADIPYVYVHDDNLGPGVRYKVVTNEKPHVVLRREAPTKATDPRFPPYDPADLREITPDFLVMAIHPHIRMGPDRLMKHAVVIGQWVLWAAPSSRGPVAVSARYDRVDRYVASGVAPPLPLGSPTLAAARLALASSPRAMSLFLGVVRVAWAGEPLMDVLLDTTDSSPQLRPIAHVLLHPSAVRLVRKLRRHGAAFDLGDEIVAF